MFEAKKAEIVAWVVAKEALNLYEKFGYAKSEEKISEWFGGYKYVELEKEFIEVSQEII